MDPIQKLISDFPNLFESENKEDNYKFKNFLITFIQHFMEQLDLISLTVDREIDISGNLVGYRKANIMRACSSAAISFPTTGIPGEGLVKNLLKTGMQQLAASYDRKKMNQIVDRITPGSQETNEAIIMVACEIARMYEEQISKLSAENNCKYCKKLAKDIANGILLYVPEEECAPPRDSVNLAKFCLQWLQKPEFANKYWYLESEGESLSIKGFKDNTRSKELLSKIGIAVAVGNKYKYYDLKSDKEDTKHGSVLSFFVASRSKNHNDHTNTKYGFRLLSIFESSSSICKNLNDITETIDRKNLYRYQSTLQRHNSPASLQHFATSILKLMTQTETDLIMDTMQKMGTNIQNLKEQMAEENQTQTASIINAVKELFETDTMNQQNFKEIVEHINSNQQAAADVSYQKLDLQQFDNVLGEIEKLRDMISNSNQQKSSTNTYYISGPVTFQNSNNEQCKTDQPQFSTTKASEDQPDAANSNRIAKSQTEDSQQKQVSAQVIKEDPDLLRKNRMKLIMGCKDQVNVICDYLYGQEILNSFLKDNILTLRTSYDQMAKLLDILPQRGNSAFIEFRNALEFCSIKISGFNE